MKGTIFQKPFEFNLRVEGESWAQGDPISGSLIIRNHSGEPVSLGDIRVLLGYADLRHVRAKSPEAFEILQIPTAGIIENMSGFVFGKGGGSLLAERYGIDFLGNIPFLSSLQYGADEGKPAAFYKGSEGAHLPYEQLAKTLLKTLKRNDQ